MNFQDVDLREVELKFNSTKETCILHKDKDLVIKFPEDVKVTVQKLYRTYERISRDVEGRCYCEEMLEETNSFVATCKVSGAFGQFLLDLYQCVAENLKVRDDHQGKPFPWKEEGELRCYTGLRHILGDKEMNLLCLETNYVKIPTAFHVKGLDHSQEQASFILKAIQ